jgi:hypothetical protein
MPTRKELIEQLEATRSSRVVCYFTGDRKDQETQIGDDSLPCLAQQLGMIGKTQKLDLLIYSRGGNTLTGFAFANALREFGDKVAVLVPFRAQSAATLIALGADEIVVGPFAQLGPIDPSITTPHGPTIQVGNQSQFIPVSVEDVANYFALARNEAGIKSEEHVAQVFAHLTQRINPLALGAVYRAREQIGMLATKLLTSHMSDKERAERIVKALTRELLSHDYIINRREAKSIGLPVVEATPQEAGLMWSIYEDIAAELKLSDPWRPQAKIGKVTNVRGVLESKGLKHIFSSTYDVKKTTVNQRGVRQEAVEVLLGEECWKMV